MNKLLTIIKKLIPKKIFRFFQPGYHFLLALTGNIVYRFPGRKLTCIGVTGTNGKSTTVELINSVLKEAGYKTGLISTIAIEIADSRRDNETARTTLGRWQTAKTLREMVQKGCTHAVIEVASEGLIQYRVWGIPFSVAVFTNLSPEHLNTHRTMGNYRNAKGKLFLAMVLSKRKLGQKKISVVNADDREAGYFSAFPSDVNLTFGTKKADIVIKNIYSDKKLSLDLHDGTKKYHISSALLGKFNAENIAAAWCVGKGLDVKPDAIKKGVEKVTLVKGRMQEIPNKKGIRVFVDYAMTPDSYEMLFEEMRKLTRGRLITVFGAAGERDTAKRPQIGEIAARMTDFIYLTDDEPYRENPEQIIQEIEAGIKHEGFTSYKVIRDRKKALTKAIQGANKGDVIVIPGMGHEKWRNVGGTKRIPWDEARIIEKILN